MIVKLISSQDTHIVRHPVLREGRPIEDCIFDGDDLPTTFHLGLFIEDQLIGVVSYLQNQHPELLQANSYQLRGMAILSSFQGKNYGNALIEAGDQILQDRNANLVWCNAREIAVNFYKRNGFEVFGNPFEIPLIGRHYSMFKKLAKKEKTPVS